MISDKDLRGFEKESRELVKEVLGYGWTGKVSRKGHAILREPRGQTTISISRSAKRARSGKNARADIDRWLTEHKASNVNSR